MNSLCCLFKMLMNHIYQKKSRSKHILPTAKNLILMCGLPGSGKTTIAKRIAEGIDRSYIIHRDDLRKNIAVSGFIFPIKDSRIIETDGKLYAQAEKLLNPIDMLFINEINMLSKELTFFLGLQRVETLILDGTFHSFEKRRKAYWFAEQNKCEPIIIFCNCSFEKALQRLQLQSEKQEKVFDIVKSPEKLLTDYQNHFDSVDQDRRFATIIQVNTENSHRPKVTDESLRNCSQDFSDFVNRLKKIIGQSHIQ